MNIEQIRPVLLDNSWFNKLPEAVINELVSLCRSKSFEKGQLVYARGDLPEGLYCVLSGKVRMSNINPEGKEMVLTWFEPGSWFGEISLFDGLPRSHDAHADEPCQVLLLPAKAFQDVLQRQPSLYPHFMRLLCQRIRAIFSVMDEAGTLSLRGQMAKRLLLMASGMGQEFEHGIKPFVSVSQESLAQMLNISRQTVNKLLKQIQHTGAIKVEYGRIRLVDRELLEQMSLN